MSGFFVGEDASDNSLVVTNGALLNTSQSCTLGDGIGADNNLVVLTGSNSILNCGSLNVGWQGSGNRLWIQNGAQVLSNANVTVSGFTISGNNTVLITDPHSGLMSNGRFMMGSGPGNELIVSNGAVFTCKNAWIGMDAKIASNNAVVVTGSNTMWSNGGSISLGWGGSGNSLLISGGALVSNSTVVVGLAASSSNNNAIVDGPGTVWNGRDIYWGEDSANNQLIVTNGALINSGTLVIGDGRDAPSNSVIVTGSSTIWNNTGPLYIGNGGAGSELLVQDGAQILGNVNVSLAPMAQGGSTLILVGSNSAVSSSGTFTMETGSQLFVSDGAKFTSGTASISYSGSANVAMITGSNSAWNIGGNLFIGMAGTSNQLVVGDGAAVSNGDCYIGGNSQGQGNAVIVNGSATMWNAGWVYVGGGFDSDEQLIVTNGAVVNTLGIAAGLGGSNRVVVTGINTICNASALNIAEFETLRINGGARLLGNLYASIDSFGDQYGALVTDAGTQWTGINQLLIGWSGSGGHLTIANGAIVQAADVFVGGSGISISNSISVINGGVLIVTNAQQTAPLTLNRGSILLNGGSVIGNSIAISNQSLIIGCGTIAGSINNFGTITITCPGGTLTLDSVIANSGVIIATNNADIEFLGPVINNGTIDIVNGFAHFPGGLINRGTYRDAATVLKMPSMSFTGSNTIVGFGCVSGKTYAVEYTDDLTSSNWLVLVGGILGNGGVTQFMDTGAANLSSASIAYI